MSWSDTTPAPNVAGTHPVDFIGVCCRLRYSVVPCRRQASKIPRPNRILKKVGGSPRNPFCGNSGRPIPHLKPKADLFARTGGRQAHA
jgi:hypothetical protein